MQGNSFATRRRDATRHTHGIFVGEGPLVAVLREALTRDELARQRARHGMVIFVPPGDVNAPTRDPRYYDKTFAYLAGLGIAVI